MKKFFHSRDFLILLPLALLICCAACAPREAEGNGFLASSESAPEEGAALFQLDPEEIEYIQLNYNDGGIIHRIDKRKDVEKIVSIFNQYRYSQSLTLFEQDRYFPYFIIFGGSVQDSQGKDALGSCAFSDSGEVRLSGVPAPGAQTVYISDQPNCLDEVTAYLYQQPFTLVSGIED